MVSLAQFIVNNISLGSFEVDPGLQLACWWALGLHSFNGLVWAPFNLLVGSTQILVGSTSDSCHHQQHQPRKSDKVGSTSLVGSTVVGRHDHIVAGAIHHQEPLIL